MFVNSETVFKSISRYTAALEQLEEMAAQYQKNIETAYSQIEEAHDTYQSQQANLSQIGRQNYEDAIAKAEDEVARYQEDIFGQDGEMIKKRIELIKPIQDSVFAAINKYAEDNKYTMVMDIATNPNLIYYSPALDKTQEIINLVK